MRLNRRPSHPAVGSLTIPAALYGRGELRACWRPSELPGASQSRSRNVSGEGTTTAHGAADLIGRSSSGGASSEAAEWGDLRGYGCPDPPIHVRLFMMRTFS